MHTDHSSGLRLTPGDGYLEALVQPSKSYPVAKFRYYTDRK